MALEVCIKKKLGNFQMDIEFVSETSDGCLGILGASGCGKSMTLKCIAGIERPDEGRIVLDGRVLFDSKKKIDLPPQKRHVGYLFQNYALFPTMTVAQNIGVGILQKDKREKERLISHYIERFKLFGLERHLPGQLSGGQQQRVALARMLASRPEMIMLDEPFSALDTHLRDAMQREMAQLIREFDGHILMVSHSRDELYRLSSRTAVMINGRIAHMDGTKEVFAHPMYVEAARLTGCKNISGVQRVDERHVYAKDWGITFETEVPVAEDVTHIGIRAHHFLPCDKEAMVPNKWPYERTDIVEAPFEVQYFVRCREAKDAQALWWKVNKQGVNDIADQPEKGYLYVPSGDIMLLKSFADS